MFCGERARVSACVKLAYGCVVHANAKLVSIWCVGAIFRRMGLTPRTVVSRALNGRRACDGGPHVDGGDVVFLLRSLTRAVCGRGAGGWDFVARPHAGNLTMASRTTYHYLHYVACGQGQTDSSRASSLAGGSV
jgi:hypothetical protein